MKSKNYHVGSQVLVRLYDGRKLRGEIRDIVETVTGRKVHVEIQHMALKLDATQILKVLK
jgi:hypothetical protein